MKFRTKQFEIEAERFTGDNYDTIQKFVGWCEYRDPEVPSAEYMGFVPTDKFEEGSELVAQVYDKLHDTWVGVAPGQWIIKGMKGEFYPCDPEVFDAKYEPIR